MDFDCRSKGLGRQMYDSLKEYLQTQGIKDILADVYEINAGSVAFHLKIGLVPFFTLMKMSVK